MSLMIKEFDINELRAGPLGRKLLHGMKTINFYFGDDHKRVPNIRVYGRMKVAKGKFGQYLEIDINKESEEFFKSLKETLSRLAEGCFNEKPWDFKSFIIEYGSLYSICCKVYSSCQLVNMEVGEYFLGHCEIRPYHAYCGKTTTGTGHSQGNHTHCQQNHLMIFIPVDKYYQF